MFYVTREALKHEGTQHYHAQIIQIYLNGENYTHIETCLTEFEFMSGNKGFEGMVLWRDSKEMFLIGLCEGNYCKGGEEGKQRGNGRMVVMKKSYSSGNCLWVTLKTIKIPPEVTFQDYSAATLYGDALAITSQEDSKLWIGRILFSSSPFEIKILEGGKIFNFPRDDNCNLVYCNIEGISFLNERMLVAVSDKMKSGGRQDYTCLHKDQSIHVFSLPSAATTVIDECNYK